jgi:uncharacterized protein YjbJ (UPF0337 family)
VSLRQIPDSIWHLHIHNCKEFDMNEDTIKGNWKELKGKAREQWGKLTDDDLDVVAGKRDQMVGKIQQAYGRTKEEAETELKAWEDRHHTSSPMV